MASFLRRTESNRKKRQPYFSNRDHGGDGGDVGDSGSKSNGTGNGNVTQGNFNASTAPVMSPSPFKTSSTRASLFQSPMSMPLPVSTPTSSTANTNTNINANNSNIKPRNTANRNTTKSKKSNKPIITQTTLQAIKNELEPHLQQPNSNSYHQYQYQSNSSTGISTTIYTMADIISQSKDVKIHHSTPVDITQIMTSNEEDIRSKNMEIDVAMNELRQIVGSFEKKVHNWQEALIVLQQVFDIQSQDDYNHEGSGTGTGIGSVNGINTNKSNFLNKRKHAKIPLGKNRKEKQKTPIKKRRHDMKTKLRSAASGTSGRSSTKNGKNGKNGMFFNKATQNYLKKIEHAMSKFKLSSWTKSKEGSSTSTSYSSSEKLRSIQHFKTSKPIIRNEEDVDGSFDEKNMNKISSSTTAPAPAGKILTKSESEQSLTEQMDNLLRKITSDEERKARAKERMDAIRIEKEMKERERIEEEQRLEKEEEAKKVASNLLRPLTEEEQHIVQDSIYGSGNGGEILAQSDNDSVQRKSMQTLRQGCWLNDEVIHYFYEMLSRRDEKIVSSNTGNGNRKRSHFFKSFFLTKLFDEGGSEQYRYANVKRWSKRVPGKDIFQLDKIFFPCNVRNTHWCCAVIFMQEKRIQFYDSMHGGGMYYLKGLMQYVKDEWKAKKGGELPNADEWTLVTCEPDVPHQENGFDCGVFTCMFADFLSCDRPLSFNQDHITQCRERIALSIMKGVAIE